VQVVRVDEGPHDHQPITSPSAGEAGDADPCQHDLDEDGRRQYRGMRGQHRDGSGLREHQRDIQDVEHDDRDEKSPRAAEHEPAQHAVDRLDHNIGRGYRGEPQTQTPTGAERQQRDVWFVVEDVEDDVRDDPEAMAVATAGRCSPQRTTAHASTASASVPPIECE
jgi:hypothetical protein